jgi:UDP-2,3-diacylglucosamine hydrolase
VNNHHHNFFVSDLHLLTSRTLATQHEKAIHEAASRARRFILGGDIFDFGWSTIRSPEESVKTAMHWLDKLVVAHPQCEFHFVFGNHDYNRRFIQAVEAYALGVKNFCSHRYFVRMGSSLFLHGDIADHPQMCHEMLESKRAKYLHDDVQAVWRHRAYDVLMTTRIHRVISRIANPHKRTAMRLLAYLNRIGHGPATGLKHVYFGHTHEPLTNYPLGGVTFHNPGAPFAGVKFRIIEAEIEE